jgi:hypothetical protein
MTKIITIYQNTFCSYETFLVTHSQSLKLIYLCDSQWEHQRLA